MNNLKVLIRKVHLGFQKKIVIIFIDFQMIFLAYFLSFYIRFDLSVTAENFKIAIYTFPVVVTVKVITYVMFGLHHIIWRYTSMQDLFRIIKSSMINNVTYALIFYFAFQFQGYPRSVIIIDWFLTIMMFGGIRLFYRYYFNLFNPGYSTNKKRCLIIGAGNGGENLVRAMVDNYINYLPVCILDNDPNKWNNFIHSVKIYGPVEKVYQFARKLKVEEIIIAIPSASNVEMREILKYVDKCNDLNITYKTVPGFNELLSGRKLLTALREVKLEDLVNRKLVAIDKVSVREELKKKVLLITGAAGSIGSEIVRQVAHFNPSLLILVDRNENNLMYLIKELDDLVPALEYKTFIIDINDEIKMDMIFDLYRPSYIFHAAAYKHVSFMEECPQEAVKNNVMGTYTMARLADKYMVYKFVLISTDKAVNPTSVMGCSKKLTELCLLNLFQSDTTKFIIVRFGNVLGSEGSVVPIFKRQIEKGRALTVTHPEMKRFLMTIPEAVSLALEASYIGQDKDILVLNMGEQIKILDIAENLIKLSGLKPYEDIQIKFTGIRSGEKMFEELWDQNEKPINTHHPKIYKLAYDENSIKINMDTFKELINHSIKHESTVHLHAMLKVLVPTYQYLKVSEKTA